jgi:hypothetical protein
MSGGTIVRFAVVVILLGAGLVWVWHTQLDASRAVLLVTAVIGGVTAIYALITYEILLRNSDMAKAASESTALMERSLRFSFAPNLLFRTLSTKDPKLQNREGFTPFQNEDYRIAMRQYSEGQQQTEFVFAVVQNVGRGSATNLSIEAQYRIRDSSSANPSYSVTKQASVQILPSDEAIAVYIFVSRVPTTDDRVELISASVTASDYYRDALHEPLLKMNIDRDTHRTESDPTCVIPIV